MDSSPKHSWSALLRECMPPLSPAAYSWFLIAFQYFPIITLIQWFTPWYPQGKTSVKSNLNLPGRYAWCVMELVGPVNLIYTLFEAQSSYGTFATLPFANKLVAGLYVLHYLNRAIITPLFFAPSMSPIHVVVALFAVMFNYLNSSCLAGWLLGYGVYNNPSKDHNASRSNYFPYVGLLMFAFGMYGNIISEHTLFRLRREAAEKKDHYEGKGKYDKVYVIPPAKGFFKTILFPHYVCEWIEWFGFAMVGFAVVNPVRASAFTAPNVTLAPYYIPLENLLVKRWGLVMPLPPILSFVNIAMTTAVRANSGRNWYVQRFGEKEVAGRGSVIPYCKWF